MSIISAGKRAYDERGLSTWLEQHNGARTSSLLERVDQPGLLYPIDPVPLAWSTVDGKLRGYRGVSYDTISYDDQSGQLPRLPRTRDNSIDANAAFLTVTVRVSRKLHYTTLRYIRRADNRGAFSRPPECISDIMRAKRTTRVHETFAQTVSTRAREDRTESRVALQFAAAKPKKRVRDLESERRYRERDLRRRLVQMRFHVPAYV